MYSTINIQNILLIIVLLLIIISCRSVKNSNGIVESAKSVKVDSSAVSMDSTLLDSTTIVLDSLQIDSTINLVGSDSSQIILDSATFALMEAERLAKAEAERIKIQKKEAIEWDIKKLNLQKNKLENKYLDQHKYFERYLKVEATNRLIHINNYTSTAIRLNKNSIGLQFTITSNFHELSKKNALDNTKKLVEATISALNRYKRVSETDYNQLNFSIQVLCYGTNSMIEKKIKDKFENFGVPYETSFSEDNNTFLQIQIISMNVFQHDYKEWLLQEQRIDRKIRIKEMKIDNL